MAKKQFLTSDEVTANLQRLFPGKEIRCAEVELFVTKEFNKGHFLDIYHESPIFYIETNIMKVAVVGKQVLEKPSIKRWADYVMWCNDTGGIYSKTRTKLGTCIPFVYRKGRWARKGDNECADLILIACGLKKAPSIKEYDPIARLKEIGGKSYVEAYKIIQGAKVESACFTRERMQHHQKEWVESPEQLHCRVTTDTGFYRFSIEVPNHTDEIMKIFSELLGIHQSVWKKKEAVAA